MGGRCYPKEVEAEIRKRAEKIIADCDETIMLAESWADNRSSPPIDVEHVRVTRYKMVKELKKLDRGEMVKF